MNLRTLLLFLFALFVGCFSIQAQPLTEDATVNLLTCGPGDDLYATFGHTAFLVRDPKMGINKVYNYGTFDFDTPNFYLKFCQGELDYFLNVTSFDRFANMYYRDGRWVHFQELNLTPEQVQAVYAFLEDNAKNENKFYRYKFLTDNCSTRPRDVLRSVLGDDLQFQTSRPDTATYRNLIDLYLTNHPWSDLGIDIALGMPTDEIPNQSGRMFLPDFLYDEVQHAQIKTVAGNEPLVKQTGVILEENRKTGEGKSVTWIFWTIFIIAMLAALFKPPATLRIFDITLFSVAGIIGILILLLWFATSHAETKANFNILWTTPTWLYGAYLLIRKKPTSAFFKVHGIIMFALVVFWTFIPQNFHEATIPIILTLAVRSWAWQKQRHTFIKKASQ